MNAIETINDSYQKIINKDAEGISAGYEASEELYVVLEGPRLTNRGHKNISKGWADFCNSGLTLKSIEWQEGPYSEETDAMAWVGGIVELKVQVGDKTITRTFRASFVLTNKTGPWLIKHEHVSAAMEDPYGIGDWLNE